MLVRHHLLLLRPLHVNIYQFVCCLAVTMIYTYFILYFTKLFHEHRLLVSNERLIGE
jgi:hypothetical protein